MPHPLVSPDSQRWAERALEHVRVLAVDIGPRPSTYAGERRAAEYALAVLTRAGLVTPHLEGFTSGRSTYRPYTWAFVAGLLGHALAGLGPLPNPLPRGEGASHTLSSQGRVREGLAALLNALGAWAFFREATLRDHWGRRLSPRGPSQNVVGLVKPRGAVRRRVVLFGHLDTHRTPIFYSSARWLWVFGQSLTGALVSLAGSALLYGLLALRGGGGAGEETSPLRGAPPFAGEGTGEGSTSLRGAPPFAGEGTGEGFTDGQAPSLLGPEHPGGAYTDTWHVITRGFKGIILDSRPADGDVVSGAHWHQMSDTFDKVDLDALARAHEWAWRLLQRIDHDAEGDATA